MASCATGALSLSAGANAQTVLEEIQVTGVPRNRAPGELAQSVTVIRDETLDRIRSTNLGETLANQLGMNSTFFGTGASRPIILGLAGPRIRTLEDGIGSLSMHRSARAKRPLCTSGGLVDESATAPRVHHSIGACYIVNLVAMLD